MNVFQQWESATFPIVLTFFIITFATAVPVLKGIPRRGNAMFSADAELINGRLAMIGIAGKLLHHLSLTVPNVQALCAIIFCCAIWLHMVMLLPAMTSNIDAVKSDTDNLPAGIILSTLYTGSFWAYH